LTSFLPSKFVEFFFRISWIFVEFEINSLSYWQNNFSGRKKTTLNRYFFSTKYCSDILKYFQTRFQLAQLSIINIFNSHREKNIGWKMSFNFFYCNIFLSQYCVQKNCVWIGPLSWAIFCAWQSYLIWVCMLQGCQELFYKKARLPEEFEIYLDQKKPKKSKDVLKSILMISSRSYKTFFFIFFYFRW